MEQPGFIHGLRRCQRIVALLLITTVTGCTSMQRVEPDAGTLQEQLAPGDELRVTDVRGESTELIFLAIDGEALNGQLRETPEVTVQLPLKDIATIEARHTSTGRSVLAGTGVALLVYVVALVLAFNSM